MKLRIVIATCALALACVVLGGCAQVAGKGTHTLFVYLCGSNLETKQGLAGKNIDELLVADIPESTKVIIETGGSTTWRSHDISNDKLQRYEVRNKELKLVDELDNASMGSADTLRDFLTWGAQNYGSEHNVLVIWDHGGQSADKVCFDENYDFDALDRSELTMAFKGAKLPFTFDLVVFDACFMSALENAALMSDYARYMVASQEVVPSSGIDYKALVEDLAKGDAENLRKQVCDAYLKKCESKGKQAVAELSLMDLSQTAKMIELFDGICSQLSTTLDANDGTFRLVSTTKMSAIYGTKSLSNLFDLQNFLDIVQSLDPKIDTDEIAKQKDKLVVYSLAGDDSDTSGISLYFPFNYDRKEFQSYVASCPIEGYVSLLKRTYDNLPAQMLAFEDKGSISQSSDFTISLTPSSGRYLASVTYTLFRQDPGDPQNYIIMGTDCEIKPDWDNLSFSSDFYPTWPTLWGQPLLTSVYLMVPHVVVFSAPVQANGDKTELIAMYAFGDDYHDGSYMSGVLWGGVNSNGVPSRDYGSLKAGDDFATYAATGPNRDNVVLRDAVVIPDGVSEEEANQVVEAPLEDGRYRFQFTVTDIAGNNLTSDYGVFEVTGGEARLVEVQPQS